MGINQTLITAVMKRRKGEREERGRRGGKDKREGGRGEREKRGGERGEIPVLEMNESFRIDAGSERKPASQGQPEGETSAKTFKGVFWFLDC